MSDSKDIHSEDTYFDGLSNSLKLRINALCDQFDDLWKQGSADLDKFVASLSGFDRSYALKELIEIDLHQRFHRQLPVVMESYSQRFPEIDNDWVENRYHQLLAAPAAKTSRIRNSVELARLGDYQIMGPIGSGGMGRVYRAEHRIMGREVAIKILKEDLSEDPSSRLRFEREVRTMAKLSHPNIVKALDAREENGSLYLVTEFIQGEDLATLIKRAGPLKPREALLCVWQAAKGLAYAHQQGIIHRDIKPSNLILENQKTVKVLDLGLARFAGSRGKSGHATRNDFDTLTTGTHILGTAAFMSPEQARNPLQVDERADIYSLGCTLFFLLTGKPPFIAQNDIETILAHIHSEPPVISLDAESKWNAQIQSLIQRMLAKSPDDRPDSMVDVVKALESILRNEQPGPKLTPNLVSASRVRSSQVNRFSWKRHGPIAIISSGLLASVLLVVFAIWMRPGGNNEPNRLSPDPEKPFSSDANFIKLEWSGGRLFNGKSDYAVASLKDRVLPTSMSIEAALIPVPQQLPANVVTFSGPRCFVLFLSNNKWGLAYFDEMRPRLVVSQRYVEYGKPTLVCGKLENDSLSLYLNGDFVAVESIEYPMQPGPRNLYIGGIPDGVIPSEQGTRYFEGTIHGVRIQTGSGIKPAKSIEELTTRTRGLFALYLLNSESGANLQDFSGNQLHGKFFH